MLITMLILSLRSQIFILVLPTVFLWHIHTTGDMAFTVAFHTFNMSAEMYSSTATMYKHT